MIQHKAYKFRIYPDESARQQLDQTFGCCRFVWNQLVAHFNLNDGSKLNEKILKDQEEFSFLRDVSSVALQQVRIDFDNTKKQFFNKNRKKRLRRMKFKKKGIAKDSYRLDKTRFKLNIDSSTIKIEKIDSPIRIVFDRTIPDNVAVRNITISKTKTGKFFVSMLVEEDISSLPKSGYSVGIDFGLADFITTSDGIKLKQPKWIRLAETKLAKAQRYLSRKVKGSNRYKRQKLKVAKIHEKVSNQRKDFLHNLSTHFVRDFDHIAVEDLSIQGMTKNHSLAKSIHDASWSMFTSMLEYKSKWYGKQLVKVDRWFPSSKTCFDCKHVVDSLPLDLREWTCAECGCVHDRDVNAAKNILTESYRQSLSITDVESLEDAGKQTLSARAHVSTKRLDIPIGMS